MIRSLPLIGMMAGLLLAKRRASIKRKDADNSIEVGASDDELRLWKAREAVRQAELRLAAQAAIRTGLEARATALTGWGAVGLLATAAALFAFLKEGNAPGTIGAAAAAIGLLIAGGMGIYADSDDVGQAFQLMPDTDSNPRRTVIPMIPSRIVIDVAMGSGDAFGVKHDRLGSLFSE